MSRQNWHGRGAGAAAVALLWAMPAWAQSHHAVDLGTLDATPSSFGFALNNFAEAAAASANQAGDVRGYLWNGGPTVIPPLAGDTQSQSFGVSDAGEVISMSFDLGELNVHGLLWGGGIVTDLGPLGPRGLNNMGTVVGYWSTSTASVAHVDHAARWSNGAMSDLGTLGGNFSYAVAVSNWGQAVGWSSLSGETTVRAALWQNGAVLDLGTLGGANSQAYAISSDSGNVAGVADTAAGAPHAFLFRVNAAGAVTGRTDLGVLDGGSSYGYGVNNAGAVVGASHGRAFRWQTGALIDLNTLIDTGSAWVLESARAINEAGLIVGTGLHHGQSRAFLLARIGDVDADGSADVADLASFVPCLGGPDVKTAPPACSAQAFALSDFDGDADADMADFAAYQRALPAAP